MIFGMSLAISALSHSWLSAWTALASFSVATSAGLSTVQDVSIRARHRVRARAFMEPPMSFEWTRPPAAPLLEPNGDGDSPAVRGRELDEVGYLFPAAIDGPSLVAREIGPGGG